MENPWVIGLNSLLHTPGPLALPFSFSIYLTTRFGFVILSFCVICCSWSLLSIYLSLSFSSVYNNCFIFAFAPTAVVSFCFSCNPSHSFSRLEVSSWRVVALTVFIFVRINMTLPVCQLSHPATWPGFHRYGFMFKTATYIVAFTREVCFLSVGHLDVCETWLLPIFVVLFDCLCFLILSQTNSDRLFIYSMWNVTVRLMY